MVSTAVVEVLLNALAEITENFHAVASVSRDHQVTAVALALLQIDAVVRSWRDGEREGLRTSLLYVPPTVNHPATTVTVTVGPGRP